MRKILSEFTLGDMVFRYELDSNTDNVGLIMLPLSLKDAAVQEKRYRVDSLIQVKKLGDDYPDGFSQGVTMRNGSSTRALKFVSQDCIEEQNRTSIITILRNNLNHELEHRITWNHGDQAVLIATKYRNTGTEAVMLEMLSSFSLGGLTPFIRGDAVNTMLVHQLRSKWSSEGRLQTSTVEELMLEPSWSHGGAYSHRFGQVGSMPVRGYFPFVAVEDTISNVSWGAQLAYAGSWQMEVYRKDDALCISGGLADREFGHWMKKVEAGEEFATPEAIVSVTMGGIDQISQRLTSVHTRWLKDKPEIEDELPIIFNEYCTSWGQPSYENIRKTCEKLKGTGIKYFVIDCGWYSEEGKPWYLSMGDWNVSQKLFPGGLEKAVSVIKDCGMIPGIWFELENCGSMSNAYHMVDHLLKRDGFVITSGSRRFWDMRDPFVIDYLTEKVIDFIKEYGFGYLKIDYNETIGIGCDGAESLGEGLRQHILSSQDFIKKIQTEIPHLVIENCAAGGHRLEPSMFAISSMSSFSDAHESIEIPIIAANLHRAMLPRQNQIWAVLRKTDTPQRLYYSIVNTFLGRMCLSGDVLHLDDEQWEIVKSGMEFYTKISPVIKDGFSYRFGPEIQSYRHPEGWQVMFRVSADKTKALAVVHTFDYDQQTPISIPIPENLSLRVDSTYSQENTDPTIENGQIVFPLHGKFQAMATLFNVVP